MAPQDPAPAPAPEPAPAPAPEPAPEPAPAPTPAPEPAPGDPPANMFADLGDTWRSDMLVQAGFEGDDLVTRQTQMDRFIDIGTFAKSAFSAQDKIRAGEVSNGLPADPTEQQVTDWRVANDVPEAADAYNLALADGVVLGDADKAILDPILAAGHELNLNNTQAAALVGKFLEGRELEMQAQTQDDGVHEQQATASLREAWGSEYELNKNMVTGFVKGLPDSVREMFESARFPDGRAIFNSPEIMVFFADKARQLNPASTVVPNSNNPVGDIDAELKSLEKLMGEDEWSKNIEGQQRFQLLVDAKNAMKEQKR
jgi:hypothetical protein